MHCLIKYAGVFQIEIEIMPACLLLLLFYGLNKWKLLHGIH